MTVNEARAAITSLGARHTSEIFEQFSPEVALYMLKALHAFTDATLEQVKEGKDSRDIAITLSRMFVEGDNASTILSIAVSDSILGKDK